MTDAQFHNEMLYRAMMATVMKLRGQGLLTCEEYQKIQSLMLQKYHPPIASLVDGETKK